jgi:MFS family permease
MKSPDTLLDATARKVLRRLVPFLVLCYATSYLNRVNIGFAKLEMLSDLSFSETVFGLGAGLFFVGYFLFEVPSNMLLHRFGANRWIARIMISWGVLSAGFAFVDSAKSFYVLRFLLGVAEAGFYPGVIFYLSYWVPSAYRGRAIALMMSAIPLSAIVGNPLSGWIMDGMQDVAGLDGWKWMFILEAGPAVLTGVAVLFYLDNSIADAKWLSQSEKTALEAEMARERATQVRGVEDGSSAFKDPRIWLMCMIYFCFVMGQYGLTFWMPTLIKAVGVTGNLKIGAMSAIPYIVTLIVMNLLGRSADRRRERRWHLIVPALVGAVGFGLAPIVPGIGLAIVALSLAAGGAISCAPLFWSLPTAFVSGAAAAVGIAVINSVGNLAGFAAPYMIGVVTDSTGSAGIGMFVIGGGLVVGALGVWSTSARMVNR